MTNDIRTLTLYFLGGKSAGKRVRVEPGTTMIGSDATCAVQVSGRGIAPVHAVLEWQGQGPVVLRNRSAGATLVNRGRADIHTVKIGDVVQFGDEVIARFEGKTTGSTSASQPQAPAGLMGRLRKSPVLMASVGGYLVALIVFGIVLSSFEPSTGVEPLKPAQVSAALEQTTKLLSEDTSGRFDVLIASPAVSRYLRGTSVADRKSVAQVLSQALEADFRRAWMFESQGRMLEAERTYRQIIETLPDTRIPASSLAARRIALIANARGKRNG